MINLRTRVVSLSYPFNICFLEELYIFMIPYWSLWIFIWSQYGQLKYGHSILGPVCISCRGKKRLCLIWVGRKAIKDFIKKQF